MPSGDDSSGPAYGAGPRAVRPEVLVVLGECHQVGRVEHGLDGGDGWVSVYEGYFLGDAATRQAALHDGPEQAARIIHQAHVRNLQTVARPGPRRPHRHSLAPARAGRAGSGTDGTPRSGSAPFVPPGPRTSWSS
ncbi:hypothetical protein [Kitasatospora griseola]